MDTQKVTRRAKKPAENMHASITKDGGTTTHRPESKKKAPKNSTAIEISGHHFCKINALQEDLKKEFPQDFKMWHIDKMFPYSKHGALWVDEPRLKYTLSQCFKKAEVLKKHNIKYVILESGFYPVACTDDDLSMELFGEIFTTEQVDG